MLERERKYLVEEQPTEKPVEVYRIRQAYLGAASRLDSETITARVREKMTVGAAVDYTMTAKIGDPPDRTEIQRPIDHDHFEKVWQASGRTLLKHRKVYKLDDHLYVELDEFYENEKMYLQLAEIEFVSAEQQESFHPPEWLGEEVTGSSLYQNDMIAARLAVSDKTLSHLQDLLRHA